MKQSGSPDASCLAALLVLIVTLPLSMIWNGFVLTILWGWFIVPVFAGAPELGLVPAIGVGGVVRYLTAHKATSDSGKSAWENFGESIAFAAFYPALTLFLGWIVHMFA